MFAKDKEIIDQKLREFCADSAKVWQDDLIENYTINIDLNKPEWRRDYEKLTHEFADMQAELYIYPFEQLHITILGMIELEVGEMKLIEIVKKNLKDTNFKVEVGYLQNSSQSVSVLVDPKFDMASLRENLRSDLTLKNVEQTRYSHFYDQLAWINFIRFKKIPNEKFFEKLWEMRNVWFGEWQAENVEIWKNRSRTLDPKKCELIERIVL